MHVFFENIYTLWPQNNLLKSSTKPIMVIIPNHEQNKYKYKNTGNRKTTYCTRWTNKAILFCPKASYHLHLFFLSEWFLAVSQSVKYSVQVNIKYGHKDKRGNNCIKRKGEWLPFMSYFNRTPAAILLFFDKYSLRYEFFYNLE